MSGPETVGTGVARAVTDGDAEAFALSDGCTLAWGAQAASSSTATNSNRGGIMHITRFERVGYSNALGFLRAEGVFGHAGASLGPGAIVAQRRRTGHRVQPLHRPHGPHRNPAAIHARAHHRTDLRGLALRCGPWRPARNGIDAP